MALQLNNATGMTKRNGTVINASIRLQIDPPTNDQLAMDGYEVRYKCAVDPTPTIRNNDLLFVITCPTNTALVSTTRGLSIGGVRQEADVTGLLACTLFFATDKAQP